MIGQNGGGDGEFDRPLLRPYGYTSGPHQKKPLQEAGSEEAASILECIT